MRNVKIVSILLILVSCSAEQRFAYLVKHHPELRNLKDTISLDTTIISKGSKVDSNFIFNGDTVNLKKGNLNIKYYYNTYNHHNYISGSVEPDTNRIQKKVAVDRIIYQDKKEGFRTIDWILLGGLLSLSLILLLGRSTKRYSDRG